ncbi:uncharacterized protein HaLaN_09071, partial [Haematococcus lacustris]
MVKPRERNTRYVDCVMTVPKNTLFPMCGMNLKASNPFVNLRKEYKGIFWQEEMIPFFQNLTLNKDTTDVCELYLEMAEKVRQGLGHIDPYFTKLADGMIAWIQGWRQLNPATKA